MDAEFVNSSGSEIKISRVQDRGPVSIPLAFSSSLAFFSVNQWCFASIQSPAGAYHQFMPDGLRKSHDQECDSFRRSGRHFMRFGHAPLSRTCLENERPRSGGTRKRLCPKQDGKSSAPLQRLVRICDSLRFVILQLCDSAAQSFLAETHCSEQVTIE